MFFLRNVDKGVNISREQPWVICRKGRKFAMHLEFVLPENNYLHAGRSVESNDLRDEPYD